MTKEKIMLSLLLAIIICTIFNIIMIKMGNDLLSRCSAGTFLGLVVITMMIGVKNK